MNNRELKNSISSLHILYILLSVHCSICSTVAASMYRVFILSDNHRLSVPDAPLPHVVCSLRSEFTTGIR